MNIVAGWGENTFVFQSLEDVIKSYGEVFGGPQDPDSLQELGIELEKKLDEEGDEVYRFVNPLTLEQARGIVELVNGEGNYDEFIFRPAWPDENVNPETVGGLKGGMR